MQSHFPISSLFTPNLWKTLLFLVVMFGLLSLTACGPSYTGPTNQYYVSLSGNDSAGDGSAADPWRTIMYAVNHANYRGDRVVINIGPGEYVENIYLLQDVILRGAGSGDPLGGGDVTYIRWATDPVARRGAHLFINSEIEIYDMTFDVGRIDVVGGRVRVENVWFTRAWGIYALQLREVEAFSVVNSQFHSNFNYGDYALNILNSTGEVRDSYFGDLFDHPINIARYPAYSVIIVTVDGVTIRGSDVCYADGIRVSGTPIVTIANSDIRREHADAEPACTILGEPITSDGVSAGIGFQNVPARGGVASQNLTNNVISGFDVGMAFDVRRTHVKAEGNTISGLSYGVLAWRWPAATSNAGALLDFGGGAQGSAGNNTFPDMGPWAFYNDEEYDVMACSNDWVVPNDRVDPDRVFDEMDDPAKGRVIWACASEPITAGSPEPEETLVQIATFTPTPDSINEIIVILTGNARCRKGPGTGYEDHDFFSAGDQTTASGRNNDASWLVVNALNNGGTCWVGRAVLETSASDEILLSLPEVIPPPLPTLTFTPTPGSQGVTPPPQGGSAPAAPSQASWDGQICNAQTYTVDISWIDTANNEDGYRILRNGTEIAQLPAGSIKYADSPPYGGPYTYTIVAYNQYGTAQAQVQDPGCIY